MKNNIHKSAIPVPGRYSLLLAVSLLAGLLLFPAAALSQDDCDQYAAMTEYGIVGLSNFNYGNNSEINGQTITGDGNTPTPSGTVQTVDLAFPPLDPEEFPSGGLNVNDATSLAPGVYGKVTVGNNKTLFLTPGDYFINEFEPGNAVTIVTSPAGKVRLYIGTHLIAGNQLVVNRDGNVADFIIYLYPYATINIGNADQGDSEFDFNGIIYAPYPSTSIVFGNNNNIQGSILSAGEVTVGLNTSFSYTTEVQEAVLGNVFGCAVATQLHHLRILHDGDGLTCMPETVTIRACQDEDCLTLYTDPVSATLSPSGWVGGDTINFSGGETTAQLRRTTVGSVTLGGTVTSPGAPNPTRCFNGVTETCALTFFSAGFIFAGSPGGAEATIPSQIAGTSSATYYLRAVKTSTTTGACVAALTGSNSVDLAYECNNPATCYPANLMSVNGGTPATIARNNNGGVTSYTSVPMTFDAGGNAPFSFSYGDAGMVTLHARKTVNDVLLTGASNAFVVKPSGFELSDIQQTAGPNLANPGAVDANGAKFVRAGEAFSATVTAKAGSGTAYSFGRESTPEGVELVHALVAPADGVSGTLANASVAGTNFSDGVATVTNLSWSEVGIVTLTPVNSNYLGAGGVTGTTSGNIGRFIPDHFAITPVAVSEGCSAGNFTYFGQEFSTSFTLTAQNTANDTTTNYRGDFAKLGLNVWANFVFTAPALPLEGFLAGTAVLNNSWDNGVAAVTASHYASRPASPVAEASVMVSAQPVDDDGVTMTAATAVQSAVTLLRYGRAVLQDAYGSEKEVHKMRFLTQYYNGSSFINNSDDTCTAYDAADLTICDVLTGPIACDDATPSGDNVGHGEYFSLSPPDKTGLLRYTLAVDPWLRYEWDGADNDYNEDPSAKVNFGLYRSNDRIINWREIFR